ncbi:MAG: outer membrane beta-barrel protein [Bacteroidales bacterium]|jgi:hypothetical protein|nr:PorT family protein [Bacteroidales bacterium]MDD4213456.1 outer membrane beta-barrel protein [Bacteroidales bacterium]
MKNCLVLVLVCLVSLTSIKAQDKEDIKQKFKGKLTQADRIILDVYTDIWLKYPSDSMNINKINRGLNFYYVREIPFGTSNFSFAGGLGFSFQNLYSDAMPINYTVDTAGVKTFGGNTYFTPIPDSSIDRAQAIHYRNNKFTVAYIDIPIEFRFRLKNNSFKFYVGGKFGVMLSNHWKYNGDNFNENYPTPTMKIKQYNIPNVSPIRYGITVRTGWKWIQAYAYYSLSNLFKKGKGPEMYPLSVGLTISPY